MQIYQNTCIQYFLCIFESVYLKFIGHSIYSTERFLTTSALTYADGICCITNLWIDPLLLSLHIRSIITVIATITVTIMTLNIMISFLVNSLISLEFNYLYLDLCTCKICQNLTYISGNRRPIYPDYLISCTPGDYSYIFFEWLQRFMQPSRTDCLAFLFVSS